jgi:hypothetical protein
MTYADEMYTQCYQKDIMKLSLRNRLLQKVIDKNIARIEELRTCSREIKGRPVK